MRDLIAPKWMYAKAAMLLAIGVVAFGLLLLPQAAWQRVTLQAIMIWAFARAYYFAFYVVEHYVDGEYRFSGLLHFVKFLASRRRRNQEGGPAT
jgi:hypothetical protein